MKLHPVTGSAKFCGPCALSAVTGLSSDTWPDEGTSTDDLERHLGAAGFSTERLPRYSPALALLIDYFCHPRWAKSFRTWLPVPHPEGVWVISVQDGSDPDPDKPSHAIAFEYTPGNNADGRRVADCGNREPRAFSALAQRKPWRNYYVVDGIHVLDGMGR